MSIHTASYGDTMLAPTSKGSPITVRLAFATSRAMTYGMEERKRADTLAESLADWEHMSVQERPIRVAARVLRGIPASLCHRMDDPDITTLPVAIGLLGIGIGGMATSLIETTYPQGLRVFAFIAAVGMFLAGLLLIRQPRSLKTSRLRAAAAVLSVGFIGISFNIPTPETWVYDTPVVDYPLLDITMAIGFAMAGVAFLLMFAASFVANRTKLMSVAGLLLVAGATAFGSTELAWALMAAPTDLTITLSTLPIALAALSVVHVVPRLRHLEIT